MDLDNQYGTLEIQKKCINLLKIFHSFCLETGVVYSVAYGTLLGAVRHQGFIPWDDDIDIIVDRDNYNKILSTIGSNQELAIERITYNSLWTDRITFKGTLEDGPGRPNIDIFIMDHSPDSKVKSKSKLYILYMLQGMMKPRLSMKKGNLIMKLFSLVTYLLGRPFSHKTKYKWYHSVSQWGNKVSTQYEQCYNTLFSYIHCRFNSGLLNSIEMRRFEDIEVYAMTDYDLFLSVQYGDYMTPPKIENRKPQHLINNQ